MAKVVVLNPPNPQDSYMNRDLMGGMGVKVKYNRNSIGSIVQILKSTLVRIPVMQLVYVATVLNEHHEILVIDAANEDLSLQSVVNKVKDFNPEFVFMAISSSGILFERDAVAKEIKNALPEVKVVTIGDTISFEKKLLQQPFDISIIGEGEKTALKISNGEKLTEIKGIMYLDNDELKVTEKEDLLTAQELDELPAPNWSLFPYKEYSYFPMVTKKPLVPVLSSRGCPYGCKYCPYAKNMGLKWRERTPENVVKEIEYIIKEFGIRGIVFRDPLFSANQKRIEKLCDLMIEKKLKVKWCCETRPELLTKELVNKMKKAGCSAINYGVESIDPGVLEKVGRKKIDLKKLWDIIRYVEHIGISASCFYILGLPGSTQENVKKDIAFSRKLNSSHVEYKIATPYPGTELEQMAIKNNWIVSREYEALGGYSATMKISDDMDPEFLSQIVNKAFKRYYFRPRYILRQMLKRTFYSKLIFLVKEIRNVFRKISTKK